ncbi:MAG: sodium:solute symporter family protein [Bacteroidota bacterium]
MAESLELSFSWIDWVALVLYFALLLFLGYYHKDKEHEDEESFLLSGRKMTLGAFVATLVSTWYGGILGIGEYSYQSGISTWLVLGVPFYIFSLLFAVFLAGKIRMNKALSMPEALADKYGETAGKLSAIPIFILVSPAPYILMLGLIFQYLTGGTGNYLWYASGVALFSVVYISYGGFHAVVRTDVLQVILMFSGFMVLLGLAMGDFGTLTTLWHSVPDSYRDPTGGQDMGYLLVWFFIALWTFVDPSFHQRAAAAKSPQVARRGIMISVLFWILFDFLTMFSGMYAWAILGPDIQQPVMTYPYLANELLPLGIKGFFFVTLLATIMSTLDSYLFLSGQTLGRDLLAPLFPHVERNQLTRISILAAALLGILLIIIYPSVIDLWYVIGSVMIPGLLIPFLGIYLPRFRLQAAHVIPTMLSSIGLSLLWLILGALYPSDGYSQAFLGLEPFYPGLFLSMGWWGFSRWTE